MKTMRMTGLVSLVFLAGSATIAAQETPSLPKSGITSVRGYYQFTVLKAIEMGDLGVHNAHALDGMIHNTKGDPFFDGMTAHCVVHHQQVPDDFGIRYSCAWADVEGDRVYFLGEDHTGKGGPPTRTGGTGKYQNVDFEIPKLDVNLVFGPEQQLEGLMVDYDIAWQSK
jgi:hypothetical protein